MDLLTQGWHRPKFLAVICVFFLGCSFQNNETTRAGAAYLRSLRKHFCFGSSDMVHRASFGNCKNQELWGGMRGGFVAPRMNTCQCALQRLNAKSTSRRSEGLEGSSPNKVVMVPGKHSSGTECPFHQGTLPATCLGVKHCT